MAHNYLQRLNMYYRPHKYSVLIFSCSFFLLFRFSLETEMWPRSVTRFGGVLIGIVIGLGVVGLWVAWTNEGFYMTTPTLRIRPGKENKGLILYL